MAGPIKWRNAYLYWNAKFVSEGTAISVSFDREWIEDTAYGDTNRTYQPGFGDFEMTVRKHYDQGGVVTDDIHSDAIANSPSPRAFYMYPDRNVTTDYWYGSGYVSLDEHSGDMSGLWDESYTIRPAGQIFHRFT